MRKVDISGCFGCGVKNPIGLRLEPVFDGERCRIEFEVRPEHSGYPGLMHGGITCVLLDEVMYHSLSDLELKVVLVNMNVDYRSPALVGDRLTCEGWVSEQMGRKIDVMAKIMNQRNDALVAEARGRFVEVDLEKLIKK